MATTLSTALTTKNLDGFFRSILDIDGFSEADSSMNGIQVDNAGSSIKKIVFAVDACLETFSRCAACGGDLLFVHHGLYWGKPLRIDGAFRKRLDFLLSHNIALYAVHLPLDQDPVLGNNAVLCDLLGITDKEPFGLYNGKKIGYKGMLKKALTIDEAVKRVSFLDRPPFAVHPFGKKENLSCAVLSGGAAYEAEQAIKEGIDLYVTGEAAHSVYHTVMESNLNMISAGHYNSEVWGVRAVMERCAKDLQIETEFIDVPTGL
ncbi:MAG: Nif3-like dinuclear metal center hexameric protein [Spirochaetaceae bacterium]|jgi:dinuclear metal center YbgI/SA1388 family protein|nr:Nif3-like dinuclear metal center hexameric protein [Spirochaetaceae bacterium]